MDARWSPIESDSSDFREVSNGGLACIWSLLGGRGTLCSIEDKVQDGQFGVSCGGLSANIPG